MRSLLLLTLLSVTIACGDVPMDEPEIGRTQSAVTTTFSGTGVDDSSLSNGQTTANSGGSQFTMSGQAGTSGSNVVMRAVIRPNLGSFSANTLTVDSVQVRMFRSRGSTGTIDLYRARTNADFGEGNNLLGDSLNCGTDCAPFGWTACSAGESSWNSANCSGTLWSGGSNNGAGVRGIGAYQAAGVNMGWFVYPTTANLVNDVQSWIDGTRTNNGWVAQSASELTAFSAVQFFSSEHATIANRPDVVIDYTCNSGYAGQFCQDVDECALGTEVTCGTGATGCTNNTGSYTCDCPGGFTGDGLQACVDIDECALGTEVTCGTGATGCTNNTGSYICDCPAGYDGDGLQACTNIDECAGGAVNACGAGAIGCTDNSGSYICDCDDGYDGDGLQACTNINECAGGAVAICGAGATDCTDAGGSYACTCNEITYTGTGTIACTDIDECSGGAVAACGTGATGCTNSTGSYSCDCPAGYDGDTTQSCTDIDECSGGPVNACGTGATGCANLNGSYACTCTTGFSGSGSQACVDVNECLPGAVAACGTGATACANTVGSWTCTCDAGYTGTGSDTCSQVNECAGGAVVACGTGATACVDSPGSYTCTCDNGFSGTGTTSCSDLDECVGNTHDCSAQATCSNTAGSFDCSCNEGYTGTGQSCSDVDECSDLTFMCPDTFVCENNVGRYQCVCAEGESEVDGSCAVRCGDGLIGEGEECDDEDLNSDEEPDACRTDCFPATCGDGVLDSGESCDEGDDNADVSGSGCRENCALPSCGDGVVDVGEVCDRGEENSDFEPDTCRSTCQAASCGDGVIDLDEECDDADQNGTSDGDCTAQCFDLDGGGSDGCGIAGESSGPAALLWMVALLLLRRRRGGRVTIRRMPGLRTSILAVIIVAGSLVAPTLSWAQESPTNHLDAARKLAIELDHRQVISHATAALNAPNNSKSDLIELYNLLGIAQGTLRQPEAATESFKRLLALSPNHELATGLSPKIRRPFQEAGGFWLDSPEGLTLVASGPAKTEASVDLSIETRLNDRLAMAKTIELVYQSAEGETRTLTQPAAPTQSFAIPAADLSEQKTGYTLNLRIRALNEFAGELFVAQHEITVAGPAVEVKPLPVVEPVVDPLANDLSAGADTTLLGQGGQRDDSELKPIYKKWWFYAAIGAGVVAIGTVTYFATRSDDGIDVSVGTETKSLLSF